MTDRRNAFIRILAAVLLLISFAAIAVLVTGADGQPLPFDAAVRGEVLSWRGEALSAVLIPITYMGNSAAIAGLCVLGLFFKRTRMRFAAPLAIGASCSAIIQTIIKVSVMRPRPDAATFLIEQGGWSFPSGHSCSGLMFYGLLAYLLWRRSTGSGHKTAMRVVACGSLCLAAVIGFSRIYVGVHYPTDVLAGWCLGGGLLLLFTVLYEQLTTRSKTLEKRRK